MTDLQLYLQISSLPENLRNEVMDFIEIVKKKSNRKPIIKERKFGCAKGFFTVKPDFDEPLEDFNDYML